MHVLNDGFRLFFLGTAAVAALHVAAWMSFLFGAGMAPAGMSPIVWHGHELVFGFAAALLAGFLLTAVPNWAGRPIAGPGLLAALFVLWLVPRITLVWPVIPMPVTQVLSAAFLPALTVVIALPIIASRNVRNYQVVALLAALSVAGIALHASPSPVMLRAAMDVVLVLMVIIGARIIPFFTTRRLPALAVNNDRRFAYAAVTVVVAAVAAGWAAPAAAWLPWLQVTAGVVLLLRLLGWKPWAVLHEPMLWILHLGYLWIAVALVLRALPLPASLALHALTMGALGSLAIGMMVRVALGHSGRPIQADAWMTTAFVLVAVAVVPRLLWSVLPFDIGRFALTFAGMLWVSGFAIYFVRFTPIMLKPRL